MMSEQEYKEAEKLYDAHHKHIMRRLVTHIPFSSRTHVIRHDWVDYLRAIKDMLDVSI